MEFRRRTIAFAPLEGSGPRVQPFTEVSDAALGRRLTAGAIHRGRAGPTVRRRRELHRAGAQPAGAEPRYVSQRYRVAREQLPDTRRADHGLRDDRELQQGPERERAMRPRPHRTQQAHRRPQGRFRRHLRTRERTALVPARLFGSRSRMRVRALATSGLATGAAECMLTLPEPRPRPITVIIASDVGPSEPVPGSAVPVGQSGVRAYAVDDAGRSGPDPGFVWFDGAGHEIARGRRLTRRDLRKVDIIRLVPTKLLSRRAAPGEHRWSLHGDGRHLVLRPQPDHIKPYSPDV